MSREKEKNFECGSRGGKREEFFDWESCAEGKDDYFLGGKGGFLRPFCLREIIVETFVYLLVNVENRLADLIRRPSNAGKIRIGHIAAGEHFIAVAIRSEEIDRRAARDAVAGRAEIDFHVVAAQDISSSENIVPII